MSAANANLPGPVRTRGLGPREIVFTLFRRRWILLAVSVPIILAAGGSLLGRAKTTTAATRVLVELTNVDQPRWNIGGRAIDYDRELSTFMNIALSVSVAERAAEILADSVPTISALDPKLAQLEPGAPLRDFLASGLDVNLVGESNILEFQFTTENPRVALMAVGAYRDAFITFENQGRRNTGAVQFYTEQVAAVRASIDSLLAERGAILGRTGFTSLEDELRYSTGAVAEAELKLREVQVDRQQLAAEHEFLRGFLNRDPREFPAGQDQSRSSTLVGFRDMVGKHEDTLNSILSVHTAESIPARQQRAVLDAALKRLHDEQVAYVESIRLALESTQERERTMASQLATLTAKNQRLPEVYQQVALLDTDIKSLRDLLDDLQGKLGEVRMAEMADERVGKVLKLSNPELVASLAGGRTSVYLAMVVILALALGIVAAFIQDSLDHRIYAPQDVEDSLKLPVFASVTRTD